MRSQSFSFLALLSLLDTPGVSAFAPSSIPEIVGGGGGGGHCALTRVELTTTPMQIQEESTNEDDDDFVARRISLMTSASTSRRHFGQKIVASFGSIAANTALVVVSLSSSSPLPAFAAAADKDTLAQDKENIVKGYKRLNYLLDNWEKETSFCGTDIDPFTGKRKCERTPTIVMDYMGYKSIKDPLFKAEKTLRRLEELAPSNREADYIEAVEKWNAAADEANTMAYTSSWAGPQNPNGGDDSIEYFLDRAKLQVIMARNVLKDVIDILGLQTA